MENIICVTGRIQRVSSEDLSTTESYGSVCDGTEAERLSE
jgi:hypothetical protein